MAPARLQITVESACNLYNSDNALAGKSDPYVIVEVTGQESTKLQTAVISNELNPVWNFVGEIAGFMDGDVVRFTVMDKDAFPKPDDFLGKAELTAQDLYPNGFHGELTLADSKTQATLSVMVVPTDCDEVAPELVEGEGVEMIVPGEFVQGITVEGSSSAEVLVSGVIMQGLPIYNPGVLTTTTTTNHALAYSAPQTHSAPQVPMNGMAATSIVESQSMVSQSTTYDAPQAPVPSESVAAASEVGMHPPVTVTAKEFATVETDVAESQSMASQSITYEAPQAPVPSESGAATCKVVVHPPVTITAEEFAKMNGDILNEPLPVTAGIENRPVTAVSGPTVGLRKKRTVHFNDTVDDIEAVDKTVKVGKRYPKRCC